MFALVAPWGGGAWRSCVGSRSALGRWSLVRSPCQSPRLCPPGHGGACAVNTGPGGMRGVPRSVGAALGERCL